MKSCWGCLTGLLSPSPVGRISTVAPTATGWVDHHVPLWASIPSSPFVLALPWGGLNVSDFLVPFSHLKYIGIIASSVTPKDSRACRRDSLLSHHPSSVSFCLCWVEFIFFTNPFTSCRHRVLSSPCLGTRGRFV